MVCSHGKLRLFLNHSGCLCGLVSDAFSRVRAKRVAERDSHSGNTGGGTCRVAAGLLRINESPLHQLPHRHLLS